MFGAQSRYMKRNEAFRRAKHAEGIFRLVPASSAKKRGISIPTREARREMLGTRCPKAAHKGNETNGVRGTPGSNYDVSVYGGGAQFDVRRGVTCCLLQEMSVGLFIGRNKLQAGPGLRSTSKV